MKKQLMLLCLCLLMTPLWAQDRYPFENLETAQAFDHLTHEMRCLVCQNQSLADSNASLAVDLKNDIYRMLQSGSSASEIKSNLMARYGEFILFAPPLNRHTSLLWFLPIALLCLGFGILVFVNRRLRRGAS